MAEEFSTPSSVADSDSCENPVLKTVERRIAMNKRNPAPRKEAARKPRSKPRTTAASSSKTKRVVQFEEPDDVPPTLDKTSGNIAQIPTQTADEEPTAPADNEVQDQEIAREAIIEIAEADVEAFGEELRWLSDITNEQVTKLQSLYTRQINLTEVIKETALHLEKQTVPKSLAISVNPPVSRPHKARMAAETKQAIWTCQKTILELVRDAHMSDLCAVTQSIDSTIEEWTTKANEMATLMRDCAVPIPTSKVKQAEQVFHKRVKETIYKVRTTTVLRLKRKEEKAQSIRTRNAERQIEHLLDNRDENATEMSTRLARLENKVNGLQKNSKAKPNPRGGKGGGLSSRPNKTQTRQQSASRKGKPGPSNRANAERTGRSSEGRAAPGKNRDDRQNNPRKSQRGRARGRGRGRGAQNM